MASSVSGGGGSSNATNIVASTSKLSQTSGITQTTLYTPPAAGVFRLNAYYDVTTNGTNSVDFTFGWTSSSLAQTGAMFSVNTVGNVSSPENNTNTMRDSFIIHSDANAAITYTGTASGALGGAVYNVYFVLEKLA